MKNYLKKINYMLKNSHVVALLTLLVGVALFGITCSKEAPVTNSIDPLKSDSASDPLESNNTTDPLKSNNTPIIDHQFTLENRQLSITKNEQSVSIRISATSIWSIKNSTAWCTPNSLTGTGEQVLVISVLANSDNEQRMCHIVFSVNGTSYEQTLDITQFGTNSLPFLQLSTTSISTSALSTTIRDAVRLTSNRRYTITSSEPSWCSVSESSGDFASLKSLGITVNENINTNSRICLLTFAAENVNNVIFTVTQLGATEEIRVSVKNVIVSSSATDSTVNITSNINWTATKQSEIGLDWFSVTPSNRTNTGKMIVPLNITFTGNTETTTRYATIVVSGRMSNQQLITQVISVTQLGSSPSINFDGSIINLQASQRSTIVRVLSNVNWTATTDQSWCTLPVNSGSLSSSFVNLSVSINENTLLARRTCSLTVTDGTIRKIFTIRQLGIDPDLDLDINPRVVDVLATTNLVSNITITSNRSWTAVTDSPSWCGFDNNNSSGLVGTQLLSVNLSVNQKVEPRTCIVKFNIDASQYSVLTINQAGSNSSPNIVVSSNIVTVSANTLTTNNIPIVVTSNINWTATNSNSCTVSPSSSVSTTSIITVSGFSANTSTLPRTACTITISGVYGSSTASTTLTVRQLGINPIILLNNQTSQNQTLAYYDRQSSAIQVNANDNWTAIATIDNVATPLCTVSPSTGLSGVTNNVMISFTNTNRSIASDRICVVTFSLPSSTIATYTLTQGYLQPTIVLIPSEGQSFTGSNLDQMKLPFPDNSTLPIDSSVNDVLTLDFTSDTNWEAESNKQGQWCSVQNNSVDGSASVDTNGSALGSSRTNRVQINLVSNVASIWDRACIITISAVTTSADGTRIKSGSKTLTIVQAGLALSVRPQANFSNEIPTLPILATVRNNLNGSTIVSKNVTSRGLRVQALNSWSAEVVAGNTLNCSLSSSSSPDTVGRNTTVSFSTNTTLDTRVCVIRFTQWSELNNGGSNLGTVDFTINQITQ